MSQDAADRLIRDFLDYGGIEVFGQSQIKAGLMVYAVTNGSHILAVGQGRSSRLKALMPGKCQKHTKSFIVAASSVIHGRKLRYFCRFVDTKAEALRIERELHTKFGECFIDGYSGEYTNRAVSMHLWKILAGLKSTLINPKIESIIDLALYDGDVLYIPFKISEYQPCLEDLFENYFQG
jgi:hypothetical protein